MTQEQLAEKTGTKKSFIYRIENGHSDIQLSTLYRLIEVGLGRKNICSSCLFANKWGNDKSRIRKFTWNIG